MYRQFQPANKSSPTDTTRTATDKPPKNNLVRVLFLFSPAPSPIPPRRDKEFPVVGGYNRGGRFVRESMKMKIERPGLRMRTGHTMQAQFLKGCGVSNRKLQMHRFFVQDRAAWGERVVKKRKAAHLFHRSKG